MPSQTLHNQTPTHAGTLTPPPQVLGTPCGQWVSMGVVSDGSYGVTPGLVFSYPVKCSGGKWSIVQGECVWDLKG